MTSCPVCGAEGLSYCHRCGGYFEDLGAPRRKTKRKKRRDTRNEKQVQGAIRGVLDLAPEIRVWDTSQPFKASITPGLPDLIIIGFGKVTFVEVKTVTGKVQESQERFLAWCLTNDVEAHIWRHEDEAVEWLKEQRHEA